MAVAWQSCGNRVAIAWQSHSNRMTKASQMHGNRVAITWHSHGNRMTIAQQSHGRHMTILWPLNGNFMAISWHFHGYCMAILCGDLRMLHRMAHCRRWKAYLLQGSVRKVENAYSADVERMFEGVDAARAHVIVFSTKGKGTLAPHSNNMAGGRSLTD